MLPDPDPVRADPWAPLGAEALASEPGGPLARCGSLDKPVRLSESQFPYL